MGNIISNIGHGIGKVLGFIGKAIVFYLVGSFVITMLMDMLGIITISAYTL